MIGCQLAGQDHHPTHDGLMMGFELGHGFDVLFGDDQEVQGGLGRDVMKNKQVLVLVDFFRGNLAFGNLAENTVHAPRSCALRAAFSSNPERPSRRSSSAKTCSGLTPA